MDSEHDGPENGRITDLEQHSADVFAAHRDYASLYCIETRGCGLHPCAWYCSVDVESSSSSVYASVQQAMSQQARQVRQFVRPCFTKCVEKLF